MVEPLSTTVTISTAVALGLKLISEGFLREAGKKLYESLVDQIKGFIPAFNPSKEESEVQYTLDSSGLSKIKLLALEETSIELLELIRATNSEAELKQVGAVGTRIDAIKDGGILEMKSSEAYGDGTGTSIGEISGKDSKAIIDRSVASTSPLPSEDPSKEVGK